ncbi:MAG: ZPR1 zinc finger domain-containing protein [Acidilobaceae archaeon]
MGLQKLREFPLTCPYCRGEMNVSVYLYEIPYVGPILITVMNCPSCGFRRREVSVAESGEALKIKVRVEGEEELKYLVVKSSTASVAIPEAGLEYVPGPYAQGVITTVEGILHEFLGALEVICQERRERCEEARKWLNEAIEGKARFTLVMCDPEGKSNVFGKAERSSMDVECPSLD